MNCGLLDHSKCQTCREQLLRIGAKQFDGATGIGNNVLDWRSFRD